MSRIKALTLCGAVAAALGGCVDVDKYDSQPIGAEYSEWSNERQHVEYAFLFAAETDACIVATEDQPCLRWPHFQSQLFSEGVQPIMNQFYEHWRPEFEQSGFFLPDLNGVNIVFDNDAIQEVCRGVHKNSAACANKDDALIIMPTDFNITQTIASVGHELGHIHSGSQKEFPSQAYELYLPLEMYAFSEMIGSFVIEQALRDSRFSIHSGTLATLEPHEQMYSAGTLFALSNLIDHGSWMAWALDTVTHMRQTVAHTRLNAKLDSLGPGNLADHYIALWDELLSHPSWHARLTTFSRFSDAKAQELTDYLRIYTRLVHADNVSNAIHIDTQIDALEEAYVLQHSSNPRFYATVVYDLTGRRWNEVNAQWGTASHHAMHTLTKDTITINSPYPCTDTNTYVCPFFMRDIRKSHAYMYLRNVQSAALHDTNELEASAIETTHDFLSRFYGVGTTTPDYSRLEGRNIITDNIGVLITQIAAKMSYEQGECEQAIHFYTASTSFTCNEWSSLVNRGVCQATQNASAVRLDEVISSCGE